VSGARPCTFPKFLLIVAFLALPDRAHGVDYVLDRVWPPAPQWEEWIGTHNGYSGNQDIVLTSEGYHVDASGGFTAVHDHVYLVQPGDSDPSATRFTGARFSTDGQLIASFPLQDVSTSIDYDHLGSWSSGVDGNGNVYLAVDHPGGAWLTTSTTLRKFSRTGSLLWERVFPNAETNLKDVNHMDVTLEGDVYLSMDSSAEDTYRTSILHLSSDGQRIGGFTPPQYFDYNVDDFICLDDQTIIFHAYRFGPGPISDGANGFEFIHMSNVGHHLGLFYVGDLGFPNSAVLVAWIDRKGIVYVLLDESANSDFSDLRIAQYDFSGKFLGNWGNEATNEYLSTSFKQWYRTPHETITTYSGLGLPWRLQNDSRGNRFAIVHPHDGGANVLKFNDQGRVVDHFGYGALHRGPVVRVPSIAVDELNNVYLGSSRDNSNFPMVKTPVFIKVGEDNRVTANFSETIAGNAIGIEDLETDLNDSLYAGVRRGDLVRVEKRNYSGNFLEQWNYDIEYAQHDSSCPHADETGALFFLEGLQFRSMSPEGVVSNVDGIHMGKSWTMNRLGNLYMNYRDVIWKYNREWQLVHAFVPPADLVPHANKMKADNQDNLLITTFAPGVTDPIDQIWQFDPQGVLECTFLPSGGGPGRANDVFDLDLDQSGNVYVTNRYSRFTFQKFRRVEDARAKRAIIVAGQVGETQYALWDATQMCANFAYRALMLQGIPDDAIQYLSQNPGLVLAPVSRLHVQEFHSEVDAPNTKAELESALTTWSSGAEDLIVYLVGPGDASGFKMGNSETLTPQELASWISAADTGVSGSITVVVDATHSSAFVPGLSADGRIAISSTTGDGLARFLVNGTVSYSYFFWEHIMSGKSVGEAHAFANASVGPDTQLQAPQIADPSGIAGATHIGNGTEQYLDGPAIESTYVGVLEGAEGPVIGANGVEDYQNVQRVFALITAPGFGPTSPGNEIMAVELAQLESAAKIYSATPSDWRGEIVGEIPTADYTVAVYSLDRDAYASARAIYHGPLDLALTTVPDVTGSAFSAGTFALSAAGLSLGTITEQASESVPGGEIMGQSLSAGSIVPAGSAVDLVVSIGTVVSSQIDEDGGTVIIDGIVLTIPEGEIPVGEQHEISIHAVDAVVPDSDLLIAGIVDGSAYEIDGLSELGDGTFVLALSYPDANQDGFVDETSLVEYALVVLQHDPATGETISLGGDVDRLENSVTVTIEGSSLDGRGEDGLIYMLGHDIRRAADVDQNGLINAVDIQVVTNAALGLDTNGLVVNVDGAGSVDAIDIQYAINIALGLQ
jgi:hypothetical protein